jgi:hypothetical protein
MSTKIGPREQALREARSKPAVRGLFITQVAAGTLKIGDRVMGPGGTDFGKIVAASSLPKPKPENKVTMPKPRRGNLKGKKRRKKS